MNETVFYYCIGKSLKMAKIFIEQVIKQKIHKIEQKNPKLLKDYMYTKEKTLDYLVLTDKGYINIEINNYNKEWRIKRDVSYACKILSNAVEKTKDYTNMEKVIQINISRLGKTDAGYEIYKFNSTYKIVGFPKILTDIIEIYMVNIDFYKQMVYNGNKKFINDNYLLCAMDLSPFDIDNISEGNEKLMEFKENLEKINDDEDFVKWMSAEKEAEIIKNTIISTAKQETQIEIAKQMINKKMNIEDIVDVTGLTKEQIEKI